MSRQNKVNPGMYTQRGRLSQDDAAREMKRQREVGSEHTWQPSKKDQFPRLNSNDDDDALGAETSGDNQSEEAAEAQETVAATAKPKQPARAKAKTAKKTAVKAKRSMKSAKTAKPAKTRAAGKTVRKAVLARNAGGTGSTPRKSAKRRKS